MNIELTKCHFCGSYDMYQGSFEIVDGKEVFVCVDCLKKKLQLKEYGFPIEDTDED